MAQLPSPFRYLTLSYKIDPRWSHQQITKVQVPLFKLDDEGPRVLVVLDKVNKEDRDRGKLLCSQQSGKVFPALIQFVRDHCGLKIQEILVVNYELFRTSKLNEVEQASARIEFNRRIRKIIKFFKPDSMLVMGADPTNNLLPSSHEQVDNIRLNGRVRYMKVGSQKLAVTSTHSLSLVSNDFLRTGDAFRSFPNLLGEVGHHFQNVVYGKNRYTIQEENLECRLIKTYQQFKKFYKLLKKAKRVSVDTETENLNRINNRILTIQFAFNGDTGWVLPMYHPESPFTGSELKKIERKLKHYFEFGTSKYHIFCYAKFDVSMLTQQLKLRWYNHRIYDIQAGEYCLDENRKFRSTINIPAWSLEQLSLENGSFAYFTGDITKQDRSRLREYPLKQVAEYGYLDVVFPYQIHEFQLAEAKRRGEDYNKFLIVNTELISDQLHQFSRMELNGMLLDRAYLLKQMGPQSDFLRILKEINDKYRNSKAAKKANKILLRDRGTPERTLFGAKGDENWIFDIRNTPSQQALFFDVLKLKGLDERKDGGWKVDKNFQTVYKEIPEVATFTDYQKATKLKNTFIDGLYRKLMADADARSDGHLRPNFVYLHIITGRAGQEKPSFHQIPSRGSLSKLIKRQFIARRHFILLKADYSAHEVRNWGIIAGDEVIANAFRVGLNARQVYRLLKRIDKELKTEWSKKFLTIDIHRVNYEFFFGKPAGTVDKNERNNVKSVVFGVIYGKGPGSLSEDIKGTEEQARNLIDLLFEKFEVGGDWLKNTMSNSRINYTAISPLGRVRHLWGYMHWNRSVWGAMNRRGPNSIIQGASSDEGFLGGRNMARLSWEMFEKHGQPFSFRALNSVHDSSENEVAIVEVPIAAYLLEHAYTTLVHRKCREVFDFPMNVSLEMEMDIGGSLATMDEYSYRLKGKQHIDDGSGKLEYKYGMLDVVEQSIKWMNDELHYKLNSDKLMKKVEHNARIVADLRRQELKREQKIKKASEIMLLTPENAMDMGFKFYGG